MNFITEYILQNYDEVAQLLTTPELKNNFLQAVHVLGQDLSQSSRRNRQPKTNETQFEMLEGYSINEFGEIIRSEQQHGQQNVQMDNDIPIFTPPEEIQQVEQHNENKLTIRQRIAQFLQKNDMLMNIPFIEKFVDKQLNVLPPPTQQRTVNTNSSRESFVNWLSNNGEYRNLPPIQRMSDLERMAQMQRRIQENQQSNEENERG